MSELASWFQEQHSMPRETRIQDMLSKVDAKLQNLGPKLLDIGEGEARNDLAGWVVVQKCQSRRVNGDLIGFGAWSKRAVEKEI